MNLIAGGALWRLTPRARRINWRPSTERCAPGSRRTVIQTRGNLCNCSVGCELERKTNKLALDRRNFNLQHLNTTTRIVSQIRQDF